MRWKPASRSRLTPSRQSTGAVSISWVIVV
jgi:hypothetical protein